MTLGSSPGFSRMRTRRRWLREGKNWEISKVRELVNLPFDHPDPMMWVNAIPVSVVDLNLRPPSWLGWMKSFEATMCWSLSAITFSTSLPRVFRRTIGQNAFGLSYDVLFGLGMTTVVEILK